VSKTPTQVRSDLSINGIGSETAPTITNLNTLTVAGEYVASGTATGVPSDDPYTYLVKHYASDVTTNSIQETFRASDGARFWRREFSGVWQPWQQVQPALGFTPVEQGGGSFMQTNKVRIGWDAGGGTGMMRLQVDAVPLGAIVWNQSAINSIANGQMFAPGNAPLYAARAWANFDGANGAIRASGNVSSVVRNNVGDYQINFATAMPDANFGIIVTAGDAFGNRLAGQGYPLNGASGRVYISNHGTATTQDASFISVAIFR
jgi:hypothetical protein